MSIAHRCSFTLFLMLLTASALWAQTAPGRGSQEPTARTSILIDRQAVRFTAPEAQEWRLEVVNQQGEVVFDSGFIHGTALEWPWRHQPREAVEGGLYAYILTVKEPNGEGT